MKTKNKILEFTMIALLLVPCITSANPQLPFKFQDMCVTNVVMAREIKTITLKSDPYNMMAYPTMTKRYEVIERDGMDDSAAEGPAIVAPYMPFMRSLELKGMVGAPVGAIPLKVIMDDGCEITIGYLDLKKIHALAMSRQYAKEEDDVKMVMSTYLEAIFKDDDFVPDYTGNALPYAK